MAERKDTVPAVKITHGERVIFPDAGITKSALADYYASVAAIMLPWVANRPVSLVRCPQGLSEKCFFQKHDMGGFGPHVHHIDIREKDGDMEPYPYISDTGGLSACVQMGTVEFHGWGSRVEDIERPDRMVFDLDPDEALGFAVVRKAALDVRARLADMGLESFPMLTGGKGIHVVVPLEPGAQWPQVRDFAQRLASALEQAEPERFTAVMAKDKRKGRIFIDWMRNLRGATAIMPYAVRARPGAPVAAPVDWAEVGDIERASQYGLRNLPRLLERARGLKAWGRARQRLPAR